MIDYSVFVPVEVKKGENKEWEKMNRTAIQWYCAETPEMKRKYITELWLDLYEYYGILGDSYLETLYEDDEKNTGEELEEDHGSSLYEDPFLKTEKKNYRHKSPEQAKFDRQQEIDEFLCGNGSAAAPFSKFDPHITTFSRYFHQRRYYISLDNQRKEAGAYYIKLSESEREEIAEKNRAEGNGKETPKAIYKYHQTGSYEDYMSSESTAEASGSRTVRGVEDDYMAKDELQYKLAQLIAATLNIKSKLGAKAGNDTKRTYFRMFFTADTSHAIRETTAIEVFRNLEKELFKAMLTGFLDFTLSNICRTVEQIRKSSLKLCSQMYEGGEERQPLNARGEEHLSAEIFYMYLRLVEGIASARSESVSSYRKQYDEFRQLAVKAE